MEAPDPVQVRPRQGAGPRIGTMVGGQPVARLQHQGAVRLHNRHGPPVCRALAAAVPLPGSATPARCGPRSAVRCCPASPSCTSLRGRLPSAPARARPSRWRRKRRGHSRPAVAIMDELVARIGTGRLLCGRAPGQHPRPDPQRVQRHLVRRHHEAEQTGSGPVSTHVLNVAPQRRRVRTERTVRPPGAP